MFYFFFFRYRLKSRDFDNPDQMRYGHSYRYTRQEFRNKADIPGSDINNWYKMLDMDIGYITGDSINFCLNYLNFNYPKYFSGCLLFIA